MPHELILKHSSDKVRGKLSLLALAPSALGLLRSSAGLG